MTAEEKGLLGSKYYASAPLYPLEQTLADINLDVINLWGRTSDLISIGMGQSTLDDLLVEVARDPGAHRRARRRAREGVLLSIRPFRVRQARRPALDPKSGRQYIDKPADYAKQKQDEYTEKNYHKVSDEVKPDWDLSGAAEDLKAILEVGYRVAEGDRFPEWKPDSEFRARREAMLGTGRR